jgi:hypothetical protein
MLILISILSDLTFLLHCLVSLFSSHIWPAAFKNFRYSFSNDFCRSKGIFFCWCSKESDWCTIHLWPANPCSHPCTSFLGAFANLWKATLSFVMSVFLSAWNNSAPTGRIFVKFNIWIFFENSSGKYKFRYNQSRIIGTLREELYTSRWLILRLSNISDKSCREHENTPFCAICEKMWQQMV